MTRAWHFSSFLSSSLSIWKRACQANLWRTASEATLMRRVSVVSRVLFGLGWALDQCTGLRFWLGVYCISEFEASISVLKAKALTVVVVGGSGHLAKTKTFPALYALFNQVCCCRESVCVRVCVHAKAACSRHLKLLNRGLCLHRICFRDMFQSWDMPAVTTAMTIFASLWRRNSAAHQHRSKLSLMYVHDALGILFIVIVIVIVVTVAAATAIVLILVVFVARDLFRWRLWRCESLCGVAPKVGWNRDQERRPWQQPCLLFCHSSLGLWRNSLFREKRCVSVCMICVSPPWFT